MSSKPAQMSWSQGRQALDALESDIMQPDVCMSGVLAANVLEFRCFGLGVKEGELWIMP